MSGKLYGVSVGPGDPGLLTIRASEIINRCAVLAVPRTGGENTLALSIASSATDLSGKEIICLDMPMSSDRDLRDEYHDKAARTIAGRLEQGSDVAFLCLGDISVYSTFSYIAPRAERLGYECIWIPGVTSFCAAASECRIPLVCGDEPLSVIPASCDGIDELLASQGTKIIMKSGKKISGIKDKIRDMDVKSVSECGLENCRIYSSAEEIPDNESYFTVIIAK